MDLSIVVSSSQNAEFVVLVVNLAEVETNLASSKKLKKKYEMNYRFQDSWVAKLPWAKSIVGVDGKVT
jgi:hypothetical protein